MIVVVVAALGLTVYGALSDRARNRRRAEEMLGPPKRVIPNLPSEARAPAYVTEAQARRRPGGATTSRTEPHTDELVTAEVEVGYASADFVTEADRKEAVLDGPDVLVCEGPVEALRELLPALEHALQSGNPLVVVASRIAPDVLGTLEVNAIQGKIRGLAVLADDAARAQIARTTGATPVDSTDRHSGWLAPSALGHVDRRTSTARTSPLFGGPS